VFLEELKPKNVEDKRLPGPCMEDTREDVLTEINAWIDDLDKPTFSGSRRMRTSARAANSSLQQAG
jgi:hypothetical protein